MSDRGAPYDRHRGHLSIRLSHRGHHRWRACVLGLRAHACCIADSQRRQQCHHAAGERERVRARARARASERAKECACTCVRASERESEQDRERKRERARERASERERERAKMRERTHECGLHTRVQGRASKRKGLRPRSRGGTDQANKCATPTHSTRAHTHTHTPSRQTCDKPSACAPPRRLPPTPLPCVCLRV